VRFGKQMGTGWFFKRDNASLDIISLRDESLKESDNFPGPDVLGQEIVEDLEAALEQFREIAANLIHEVPTEKNQIDER
jgi:type I restriction enzyme M protein